MKKRDTCLCWSVALLAVASMVCFAEETGEKPATKPASQPPISTNDCVLARLGDKGFTLAVCGGLRGNIMEAVKPRISTTPIVQRNVTLRVELDGDVKMAFSQSAGKYVSSVSGSAKCETIDNTTSNVVKTGKVPVSGDLYQELIDELAANIVAEVNK